MDLTDGLAELDLDSLSIEDLTPAQRRDFERAVVDGRLGGSLEAWVLSGSNAMSSQRPWPYRASSLTELTGKPPHPELTAHAVELCVRLHHEAPQRRVRGGPLGSREHDDGAIGGSCGRGAPQ